jgi:hypothetical protein
MRMQPQPQPQPQPLRSSVLDGVLSLNQVDFDANMLKFTRGGLWCGALFAQALEAKYEHDAAQVGDVTFLPALSSIRLGNKDKCCFKSKTQVSNVEC